ncbi:hypothetical protein SAMN05192550_1488 [Flavobacterium glycines]|uniref:Phosphatase n=1 Tax=Flavobacterium glycines TaxID=551990 RepID=A0A1B9DWW3_9FLAO|nr:hypothetical protein [Flavobacterium glycines]OCB74181.1 hypothetical protein FBGL_02805 [Flavobacterium glycines]GEL09511.1 hypothetical protein FGL01_02500 [Flavobacterium glycines]SDJ04125.1 hypothetical protein SAMN05192550_1488 [Flavobacterium glycines]
MKKIVLGLLLSAAIVSCDNDKNGTEVVLADQSVTPVLLKKKEGFEKLELFSLLTSDDVLPESPNFVFGGSADGSGLLKNEDGTFTFLVNNEDNFSVSRITLDNTFKPIRGEYLLNSNGGTWRLCGASMATPAVNGFGPLYLTCGESGEESRTHGVDPYGDIASNNVSKELPGLGRLSAENALPLKSSAFPGKTVVVIGDDDSGTYGGQVFMYVSNTVGDLTSGSLYMMKRNNDNQREKDMIAGQSYPVSFVKIDNHTTMTGAQINALVNTLKGIKFGRVEDLDYRKGEKAADREIYFNVTGQNTTGVNADASRTKYGRVYQLNLDENNPLSGTLRVLLDGDDRNGIAKTFQNPDNICVTKNYVYVQEDANGYGDETHDGYIYQYDIANKTLKVVVELDHRRTASDAAKYNVGGTSKFGDWEYGALIDVSEQLGIDDTFLLSVQPHTWTGDKYKGVDGGTGRPNEQQASQIVLIKGLAR